MTKDLNASKTLFGKTSIIHVTVLNNLGQMYDNKEEYVKSLACKFSFEIIVIFILHIYHNKN